VGLNIFILFSVPNVFPKILPFNCAIARVKHTLAPLHKQVKVTPLSDHIKPKNVAIVNQHPPTHRPLDAYSYSVVDEPQLGLV